MSLLEKVPKREGAVTEGIVVGMPRPSEALRKRLLAEELKLRSKQPPHWAKTKYRKYALLQMRPRELEVLPDKPRPKPKRRRKRQSTSLKRRRK